MWQAHALELLPVLEQHAPGREAAGEAVHQLARLPRRRVAQQLEAVARLRVEFGADDLQRCRRPTFEHDPGEALAGAFFFAFELSYEVIYDLRDAPGDAEAGVRTYPVVHGERGALRIIDGLLAVSGAILVIGYAASAVPWRLFIMICAPLIQLVVYKRAHKRGITSATCIAVLLAAGWLMPARSNYADVR